jgi:hypothetical protein
MKVLQPFEQKIRSQILDELAIKPVITMTALKERIENVFGRGFGYEYIRILVYKVRNEIVVEIDRTQIEQRMAFTRENYRLMREELLKIVYWKVGDPDPKPLARDKIEAAKNVGMLDLAILNAEAAAGMYKKPVEALAREFRYDPLPPEVRAVVVAAWIRGDMLPKATVEAMVPIASQAAASPSHERT